MREAVKPADPEHPFGHGKFETLSSLFESLLLVAAAVWIIYEGVDHLRHPEPVDHLQWGMAVILISMILSYAIYRHNLEAARVTDSRALHVNALHFLSDVVASAGVLVGLLLLELTGWTWIDPAVAFLVAGYIFAISWRQVKESLGELADRQLPDSEIRAIREAVEGFRGQYIDYHDLRTRKSGSTRHVDFHLNFCGKRSVEDSHALCDEIEVAIARVLPGASVQVHVEPCEQETRECHRTCKFHKPG